MVSRKLHAWLLRRWYGNGPIGLFIPLSGLFAVLSSVRRWCYRQRAAHVTKLPVPVIIVGNITSGGTGKTPFVIWLTRALQERGYKPGIITRGYGGKSEHWPMSVTAQTDPVMVGDEAVLLATRTEVPVAAGPDRLQTARCVLNGNSIDVIVSDDGLQHYQLSRDVSFIMLDGQRYLGNGWLLPAGPLRESAARLNEVDFVICKSALANSTTLPTGALIMHLSLEDAVNLSGGYRRPLAEFAGKRVHAVAGIGYPQQFFEALGNHGLLVDGRPLPDHAELSEADLTFDDGAPVLMTEKDAIKCRDLRLPHHWYVPASVKFSEHDNIHILNTVAQKLSSMGAGPMKIPEI
jgi:tetraacyldisaccharide 4'-kinase